MKDYSSIASNLLNTIRTEGWRGAGRFLKRSYLRFRSDPGTHIYDKEWDVLVILDACRLDLMEDVGPEYEYIKTVDSTYSVASRSHPWMSRNFSEEFSNEMAQTAYVTANPYSQEVLEENDFLYLDEVWQYAWDTDLGTVPPRPVTDRAITIGRDLQPSRLILHYMQPHVPFIASDRKSDQHPTDWGAHSNLANHELREGNLSVDEYWEMYAANLRLVLNDLEILVSNIDAEQLVISSDHGNAIGEHGYYGHPGVRIPVLYTVPWITISTTDENTHSPATYQTDTVISEGTKKKLASLGYLSD